MTTDVVRDAEPAIEAVAHRLLWHPYRLTGSEVAETIDEWAPGLRWLYDPAYRAVICEVLPLAVWTAGGRGVT